MNASRSSNIRMYTCTYDNRVPFMLLSAAAGHSRVTVAALSNEQMTIKRAQDNYCAGLEGSAVSRIVT